MEDFTIDNKCESKINLSFQSFPFFLTIWQQYGVIDL